MSSPQPTPDPTISVHDARLALATAIARYGDARASKCSPITLSFEIDRCTQALVGAAQRESAAALVQAEQARDEARQERDKRQWSQSVTIDQAIDGLHQAITSRIYEPLNDERGDDEAIESAIESVIATTTADAQRDLLARVREMVARQPAGSSVTAHDALLLVYQQLGALLPDPPPSDPPAPKE